MFCCAWFHRGVCGVTGGCGSLLEFSVVEMLYLHSGLALGLIMVLPITSP